MRILLGLGQPELPLALLGDPRPQRVHDVLARKHRGHVVIVSLGILDHAQKRGELGPLPDIELREARLTDGPQDLARPVGPEIDEEHPVAVMDAGVPVDHDRFDELVETSAS